jgi:hypothetical protein
MPTVTIEDVYLNITLTQLLQVATLAAVAYLIVKVRRIRP